MGAAGGVRFVAEGDETWSSSLIDQDYESIWLQPNRVATAEHVALSLSFYLRSE